MTESSRHVLFLNKNQLLGMLNMINLRRLAMQICVCWVLAASPSPVQAGVLISIGSITLNPGQTGMIDVRIRSDSNDELQSFGFRVLLDSLAQHSLSFSATQSPPFSEARYVLNGDSAAETLGPFDSVTSTVFANDTYDGADLTNSGLGISLTTDYLLARISVSATSSATLGVYRVSLNPSLTTLFDASAGSLALNLPNEGVFGLVTIAAAQPQAIPEPSTATVFSFMIFVSVGLSRYRTVTRPKLRSAYL